MSENNNNNLDEKIKDFSNYLLDIGLLIGSSYNDFIKKFKEINEKEKILLDDEEPDENFDMIYFKDNMSKTMIKFYDSLNEDKKKLTTFNIFNIYSKKKGEKNNNELSQDNFQIDKNEIIEEEGTDKKNNKINDKIEYKEERFEITIYSQKNQLILKLSDNSESDESSKNINNKISSKKKHKKIKNNLPKKNERKNGGGKIQLNELNENCTFQPNFDKKEKKKEKKNMQNISEFFNKLSQKNTKREKDVEDIKKEMEKECPFQPNLKKNKGNKEINRKDFEERMKRFEESKKEKEKRRKKDEEEEFNKKCPFMPNNKRSNSFSKSFNQKKNESFSSENIYKRLHDENRLIKLKYEENLQKLLNDIKDRANHPIVNHNNTRYLSKIKFEREKKLNVLKNNFSNIKYYTEEKKEDYKTINRKRIEELYEEYKKMKNEISKNHKTEADVDVLCVNNKDKENNSNNEELNKNENLKQNDINENNENIENRTTNEIINNEKNN